MKQHIKYIVSLCFFALTTQVNAQDSLQIQVKDSIEVVHIEVADTLEQEGTKKYFSIILSADYGKLITTIAQLENKYEFNLAIQFSKNIRATADVGYGQLAPPNAIENGTYTSTGSYARIGVDYIFTLFPKTYLSLGGMYAMSTFKDEGTVEINSEIWLALSESFTRNDLNANWAEFVITSEATVFNNDTGFLSNFYWGIKFRLRFMIERPNPENFDVYAIPGYGRTWNNVVPAVNLFISYKF